ncbi:MAG TPA: aminotransferase class I/II-fold pyridoxal phosphate-dependent enzyme [Acidimicrobiales bacterium]|nr:aminotransferase class I/II-fold pyridoxal phosphate-dependent enzyme [Acidimicrobiales bacterium]
MTDDLRPETTAIRAGRAHDGASLAPVLWPSTTYRLDDLDRARELNFAARPPDFYGRNGSPTVNEFADAVAALEGAEAALALGSGMGALSTIVFALCSAGDHIVAQHRTFSVTNQLLTMVCPRFGIDVTFVDATDVGAVEAAVEPGRTMLVIVETPANPGLDVIDLAAIGQIAGPFTVVDSTMATPVVQRPLEHGIDLVMHAATKGIAGHNDAMLGVVAGEQELIDVVWRHHLVHGAVASAYDSWNGLRGLRTLHARVRQQSASAAVLADRLADHASVASVRYPGRGDHPHRDIAARQMENGGTIVAFDLAGGADVGAELLRRCRLVLSAASFGGPETLITHPASTTAATLSPDDRAAMGIGDGTIRLSVGLEHVEDLWDDLDAALGGVD